MTSRHYSSDAKEVNILMVVDCFKIGGILGVFNIAIYGKTVRCSFNSFEQCIFGTKKCIVTFSLKASSHIDESA